MQKIGNQISLQPVAAPVHPAQRPIAPPGIAAANPAAALIPQLPLALPGVSMLRTGLSLAFMQPGPQLLPASTAPQISMPVLPSGSLIALRMLPGTTSEKPLSSRVISKPEQQAGPPVSTGQLASAFLPAPTPAAAAAAAAAAAMAPSGPGLSLAPPVTLGSGSQEDHLQNNAMGPAAAARRRQQEAAVRQQRQQAQQAARQADSSETESAGDELLSEEEEEEEEAEESEEEEEEEQPATRRRRASSGHAKASGTTDAGTPGSTSGPASGPRKRARRARSTDGSSAPRSSRFRGVTKHRRSGRWEAHIWLKEQGKQIYLGGYECEEHAAEAFDIVALKSKGRRVRTNFELSKYSDLLGCIDRMSTDELIMAVRRQSQGFSRGSSSFRGVTAHPSGRWESRIGIPGSKHIYLGLFQAEADAARMYDRALVRLRGRGAATNFALSEYNTEMADYHRWQAKILEGDVRFKEIQHSPSLFERWIKGGCQAFEDLASLTSAGPSSSTAPVPAPAEQLPATGPKQQQQDVVALQAGPAAAVRQLPAIKVEQAGPSASCGR